MADNRNNTKAARFATAKNPWLGLGSYHEGQQLYGRDKETADLTDIIVHHTASVVYGKSGIGKSSLLRAGVFPQLRQNGFVPIYLRLAHNTDVPYAQQVENAIAENITLKDLLPDDIPDMGLWDFLHRHQFLDSEGNTVTPVIVLDQFEEIFTLTQVEHKPDVQAFFAELADVLNDVKPDRVIEAEAVYNRSTAKPQTKTNTTGFVLQSLSSAALKYEKSPSFRIVFSLRDDSLYLLERSSAKIPVLKANRYNLRALDESSALDVITKPYPGLFTDNETQKILDGLAYYEYDDYRVVDPAILSLFLYSYYEEKGQVSYSDIFGRYYQNCTKDIKESSINYIEDHLLTERGNRNQIPFDDIIAAGVAEGELELLLQRKILKTEKRKGHDYAEFSHDRLCEQAQKHREERKQRLLSKKMRKRISLFGCIALTTTGIMAFFLWQNSRYLIAQQSLVFSEMQKDSIQQQRDAMALLNDSITNLNNALNDKVAIIKHNNEELKMQYELLKQQIEINNKQEAIIKKMELKPVYDGVTTLYDAVASQDSFAIRKAANELQGRISLFSDLRPVDSVLESSQSVYSSHSADSILATADKHVMYDIIERAANSYGGQTADASILTKVVNVKANMSTKYRFASRGHQELAVVAESGGLITLRIHVVNSKGLDERFDDVVDIKVGRQRRVASFDLPRDRRNTVELEIVNCTHKDISCVVISN